MSCIFLVYLVAPAVPSSRVVAAGPQAAAVSAASNDPDALYRKREDLDSAKRAVDIWAARASTGKDFEASWKLARACYWLGTTVPDKEQRAWLDKGVAAGKQAGALEPDRPEGHFWLAANLGTIAQSGGFSGLKYKGDVRTELEWLIKTKPGWQSGSAEDALGMWYVKVPGLFGGDDKKGIALLRQAVAIAPKGIHVNFDLAETLADDKKTRPEAIEILQRIPQMPHDPDFVPEDKRIQAKAAELLAKLTKK